MRIVGGRLRGRRLLAPEGRDLRPTGERAREAVFNVLLHGRMAGDGSAVEGARVLDAFCGTGSLGLEALSRGAAHVTLMDSDDAALDVAERNARALAEPTSVTVLRGDATNPPPPRQPCSLVFLDPPYRSGLAGRALSALAAAGWLMPDALAVVETASRDQAFEPPAGFVLLDRRRYGAATVSFVKRAVT